MLKSKTLTFLSLSQTTQSLRLGSLKNILQQHIKAIQLLCRINSGYQVVIHTFKGMDVVIVKTGGKVAIVILAEETGSRNLIAIPVKQVGTLGQAVQAVPQDGTLGQAVRPVMTTTTLLETAPSSVLRTLDCQTALTRESYFAKIT